ncbi:hypothetical protein J1614_011017 [Plenodomus biglobosus]|nr:hypothetical protein J1614_011017 [Plenodomus biglobosus]
MASAVQVIRNYDAAVAHARSQGIFPEDPRHPRIIFPAWNRPAQHSKRNAPTQVTKPSRHGQCSSYSGKEPFRNPFGSHRDRRPPGGGFEGFDSSNFAGSATCVWN